MKIIKGFFKIIGGLLLLTLAVYFLGPRPEAPLFPVSAVALPAPSLAALERSVNESERSTIGIRPGCEARFVWADSVRPVKTKVAFLYLPGFTATGAEGEPVDLDIAHTTGNNLFVARMYEHGLDEGENNMIHFTADRYVEAAEQALNIAKQTGDSVVVIGTSGGGAMALFLASRHPEIKAVVAYSPAIALDRGDAWVMTGPWGLQIMRLITGKNNNDRVNKNEGQKKYWTDHFRHEGTQQFAVFEKYAMTPATFQKIYCPVFLAYYYENEIKKDHVVSVDAMLKMYDQLGTPAAMKRKEAFPNTHNHVIASSYMSDDWKTVESETLRFLKEIGGVSTY